MYDLYDLAHGGGWELYTLLVLFDRTCFLGWVGIYDALQILHRHFRLPDFGK